jgi:hypothetical protein
MPPRNRTEPDDTTPDTTDDSAPIPASASADVVLAVGYPHDEFTPFGSDDTDHKLVITTTGTKVPAGRVDDIKAAAKAADVTIREVR